MPDSRHSRADAARAAALDRIDRRAFVQGQVVLPALPALADRQMARLERMFDALEQPLADAQRTALRASLHARMEEGYRTSAFGRVVVRYRPSPSGPRAGLDIDVELQPLSRAESYEGWLGKRRSPLFGPEPDAMLMHALDALSGDPAEQPVLDVGAGTGRNALPVARRGHPVRAVELTEAFAWQLRIDAEKEGLPVTVHQANVFSPSLDLPPAHHAAAVASELTSELRSARQLGGLLRRMAHTTRPGGRVLISLFVADDGYEPDDAERQAAEHQHSTFYTPAELSALLDELPLVRLADEPVVAYERAHGPEGSWPPTPWYEAWAAGRDVFPVDDPPIRLRWMLFERT